MKRLLPALLLLSLALPAFGATRQYGMLSKWQQTGFPSSTKAKNQRIAVIYDRDLRESSWSLAQTCDMDLFAGMGKLIEALRKQGADVNVFDYSLFADSNGVVPTSVLVAQTISGTGIPGATTVAWISPMRDFFEMNNAATANNQNATLTIGGVASDQWKIVSGTKQVRRMVSSNPAFRTLGDTYGLAVMVGFRALFRTNATTEAKFFCPESTNVQMIHVGGIPSYASYDDGGSTASLYGTGDSTRATNYRETTASGRGVVPYTSNPDTLYGESIPYACPPVQYFGSGTAPTGFRYFVRLFHPVLNTGNGAASDSALWWGSTLDSTRFANSTANTYGAGKTLYRLRYGWWATHRDSIVRQPYEPMPIAWRAYWTDTNADGKDHTDFVKVGSGLNTRYCVGDVAFALCARYIKLKPVLMAFEWDDMGNMNPTQGHGSPYDAVPTTMFPTGTRPGNADMDSLVREMKNTWGVKLTANIAPDSIVAYANGTPENQWASNPRAAVARHVYYFQHGLPWIYHAHDSSSSVASNIVGKFGGYYPHNGQNLSNVNGYDIPAYTHRVQSFSDPNNLYALNDPNKYGVLQRLQRSDSLRRVYCPSCPLPPYLSFPNNDMLPLDWTVRSGGGFASMTSTGALPLSSYFTSLAGGLHVPTMNGTLYLRGYYYVLLTTLQPSTRPLPGWYRGVRYPYFSPVNRWIGFDRDSLAMQTYWLEPEGEYRVQAGIGGTSGYNLRVVNVGTVPIGSPTGNMGGQFAKSQQIRTMLLGITNPIVRQSVNAADFGETWSSDYNGVLSGTSNLVRNGPGRVRVVYCHPLGVYGPNGLTDIAQARSLVLRPLRALSAIAGHSIHQWVYPWETIQ